MLGILSACVFVTAAVFSIKWDFVDFLNAAGPRGAQQHLELSKDQDAKLQFRKAWTAFAAGEFMRSEEIVRQLLGQDPPVDDKTFADSLFLMGHLALKTNRHEEAVESFQEAFNLYQYLESFSNMYKTKLGLAEVAIEMSDLVSAEDFLNEAAGLNETAGKGRGHFFYIHAKLSFNREDYASALEKSFASYDAFIADKDLYGASGALSDIGFYSILQGDLETGFEKTMEAQDLIQNFGDQDKYYGNMLNLALLRKCEGHSYNSILERVKAWSLNQGDSNLSKHIAFVLNWSCAGPDPTAAGSDDLDGEKQAGEKDRSSRKQTSKTESRKPEPKPRQRINDGTPQPPDDPDDP